MFTSRESIFKALFALLCATEPPPGLGGTWNLQSRDLQQWDQIPSANKPAMFLISRQQRASQDQTFGLTQWKLDALLIVYWETDGIPGSEIPRDQLVNDTIDVFDKAINYNPGSTNTLGGLVLNTYIDGAVRFDNGLNDQQAVLGIPITMLVGAFGA